jgi:hypothetical protein
MHIQQAFLLSWDTADTWDTDISAMANRDTKIFPAELERFLYKKIITLFGTRKKIKLFVQENNHIFWTRKYLYKNCRKKKD